MVSIFCSRMRQRLFLHEYDDDARAQPSRVIIVAPKGNERNAPYAFAFLSFPLVDSPLHACVISKHEY
jgi:hypothetical protein